MGTTTASKPRSRRSNKSQPQPEPEVTPEENGQIDPIDEEELHAEFNRILEEADSGPTSLEKLGFIRITKEQYEWITYPDADPEDALKIELRSNPSVAETDAVPLGTKVTYDDLREYLAPYIRNWNVKGINRETGEVSDIPPPKVGGPNMMLALEKPEIIWIAMALKYGYRAIHTTEEGKKNSKKSDNTANPSPAILKQEKK